VPTPPARTLGDHLMRLVKLIQAGKHLMQVPHPEVDPFHYPILFRVWSEPQRLSDLAQALHADVSTTSRQVSHLTQLGLIEKVPDPQDRRAAQLGITEQGKAFVLALRASRNQQLDEVMAGWSDEDRDQFTHLLARFLDDLETGLQRLREARSVVPASSQPTTDQQEC
jgi:DNA-binding MarR family transcriptional regulator